MPLYKNGETMRNHPLDFLFQEVPENYEVVLASERHLHVSQVPKSQKWSWSYINYLWRSKL